MNKEEKFRACNPDTDCFTWQNKNPKNKITADCVPRALSAVLELPYEQVLRELVELNLSSGYMVNSRECFYLYLKQKGFERCKQPKSRLAKRKITGKEFCRMLKDAGAKDPDYDYSHIFCNIGRQHVTAVIDYKIHDTWNCSDRYVGVWWIRKKQN